MSIDLTATRGPLKGQRFKVGSELVIGRTSRGVNLPDPTVSLRHAQISQAREGYAVVDLESATGTRVNDDPVPPNRPIGIDVGDEITIGDTVFVVGSARVRTLRALGFGTIPVWILLLAGGLLAFAGSGEPSSTLTLQTPIRTHEGTVQELTFPRPFLRRHGMSLSTIALRQVTDLDDDGIDEMWLQADDREHVVTFDRDGTWRALADLPLGCTADSGDKGRIRCGGADHHRLEDGRFHELYQLEPVAWLVGAPVPPVVEEGEEAPPPPLGGEALAGGELVPFRIRSGATDQIAGFLADRGVTEPVHYLVCEGVVPGLPAQAVLADGTVRRLSRSCGNALRLGGPRAAGYEGVRIGVLALSAQGRYRLADHLAYTLSGGEQGLFLDPEVRAFTEQLRSPPHETRGGLSLDPAAMAHVFDPRATGLLDARIALATDLPRPADVVSTTIIEPGTHSLDLPGDCRVVVDAEAFRCSLVRGCLPGATFLAIRSEECPGLEASVGYGAGRTEARGGGVDLVVEVESEGSGLTTDVLRAVVSARSDGTAG